MGHIRLGRLHTSKKWLQIVALLERNATVDAVAAQAANAAEEDLAAGATDPGFIRTCWLLAQIPLAARGPNFADALRDVGLEVGPLPDLFEISSAFSETVDRFVEGTRGHTDFGEMAQLAAAESISAVASRYLPSLFGASADDTQRAIGRF